jgi:GxxExxY protein
MSNDRPTPIPDLIERVAKEVIDASFKVYQTLGPGLLESVYETCLVHEFSKRGLSCVRQTPVTIKYDDWQIEAGLRIDILVEDSVVVELKAVEEMKPLFEAQLLTYLKLSDKRLGFLINFNSVLLKQGLKRMVL